MSLETGLVNHLKADPALAALVGSRVYHETLPQNPTYPALAYARTSSQRSMTLSGPIALTQVRLAIDVWARSSSEMLAVSAALKGALDGVTGDLGGQNIQHAYYESEADLSEFDGDRADRRVSFEFVIWLNE